MAGTGYPQMPPMGGGPPMGGPPMGPPMGAPPMRATPMPGPVRHGTSKAVPIVVSAGLAVGVFCGLLFGVGTGKVIHAAPSKGTNVKAHDDDAKLEATAPKGLGATTSTPVAAKPAPPPQTAQAPTPPPPKLEAKTVKLTVQIKPEAAAKDAKISIDGQEISGNSTEVAADKKSVKVEVRSNGYRTADKKIDLLEGELTLEIEMSKKPASGGAPPAVRPPKRIDKPPGPSNNGGLIDI